MFLYDVFIFHLISRWVPCITENESNYAEDSPSWEANSRSASLPLMKSEGSLQCLQVQTTSPYRDPHKSNPQSHTKYNNLNFILLSTYILQSVLLTSGIPTKIVHAFTVSLMCAVCPAYLILLHLFIIITIFSEEYRLWSFLLWIIFQSSATYLGPNILLIILFSDTANVSLRPFTWQ
jgi:hypothetical protein